MGHPLQDPFALVGSTLDGRFVIDRVVARGGFGVVYQAWHTRLLRPVAIKALVHQSYHTPEMRETTLGAFEQEARLLAHLDHPAFVRVYDAGESFSPNGVAFEWVALEWIHGESLDDLLKRRCGRPMSPAAQTPKQTTPPKSRRRASGPETNPRRRMSPIGKAIPNRSMSGFLAARASSIARRSLSQPASSASRLSAIT